MPTGISSARQAPERWAQEPTQPIFGGTTEIQKEIIARSLGLWPDQAIYEVYATDFEHDVS